MMLTQVRNGRVYDGLFQNWVGDLNTPSAMYNNQHFNCRDGYSAEDGYWIGVSDRLYESDFFSVDGRHVQYTSKSFILGIA